MSSDERPSLCSRPYRVTPADTTVDVTIHCLVQVLPCAHFFTGSPKCPTSAVAMPHRFLLEPYINIGKLAGNSIQSPETSKRLELELSCSIGDASKNRCTYQSRHGRC